MSLTRGLWETFGRGVELTLAYGVIKLGIWGRAGCRGRSKLVWQDEWGVQAEAETALLEPAVERVIWLTITQCFSGEALFRRLCLLPPDSVQHFVKKCSNSGFFRACRKLRKGHLVRLARFKNQVGGTRNEGLRQMQRPPQVLTCIGPLLQSAVWSRRQSLELKMQMYKRGRQNPCCCRWLRIL